MENKQIHIKFVDAQAIRIKLHEGVAGAIGTTGATGTTGAQSTVPGTTGAIGSTGATGTTGAATGTMDHALLSNLDYNNSNHIGFQKSLTFVPNYKAYEIE